VVIIASLVGVGITTGAAHADPIGAQQLRFFDGRGDIYSVKVFGYNQNGNWINGQCFDTPNPDNPIDNWWWLAGYQADVYTYRQYGCPAGTAVQQLYITVPANPTTYWRCLEDTAPYSDWSCERTG
jgi:hypothetical protein